MTAVAAPVRALLIALLALAAAGAAGLGVVVALTWLSAERQRFGPYDPRYLVFVRGTRTERIGLVAPEPGSVAYEAEGADRPGVGFLHTRYRTKASPDALLAAFAAGCARLGLKVEPGWTEPPPEGERRLGCVEGHLGIAIAVTGRDVRVLEDRPN